MKKYKGGILLCWGMESKVLIGCAFFNDEVCVKIIYDKPMIEKILSLKLFPASISYDVLTRIKPVVDLTRSYFDGHLRSHSNGMLQIAQTRIHADIKDEDYPRFANSCFGKYSDVKELDVIAAGSIIGSRQLRPFKKTTNFRITIGYRAVISVDIHAANEKAGKKIALEDFKAAKDKFYTDNVILEDDNFNAHGIVNMDATWNNLYK